MLQRHARAAVALLEKQFDLRDFFRQPVGRTPLHQDSFARFPRDHAAHFETALQHASGRARCEVNAQSCQSVDKFPHGDIKGRRLFECQVHADAQ